MSGESQVKDCPSASSGRAWASRKGSPRAPGEFLAFPLPTCPPTLPNTSISQLPTPIHPQNYRALPALKCSRAQLWDKELGSSPGLPLLLWRTLAWPPASLILTVFLGSSLEFGLVDAPPQTRYASGTGWLGQLWPILCFLTCRGNRESRVCLAFRYVCFGPRGGWGLGRGRFRIRVS